MSVGEIMGTVVLTRAIKERVQAKNGRHEPFVRQSGRVPAVKGTWRGGTGRDGKERAGTGRGNSGACKRKPGVPLRGGRCAVEGVGGGAIDMYSTK